MDTVLAQARANAVRRSGLLASLRGEAMHTAAEIARYVTGLGSGAVHILDDRWQYRVGASNAPIAPYPAEDSLCLRVVEAGATLHTRDVSRDERFAGHAIREVSGYVGSPVVDPDGVVVGTVCAFDSAPREASPGALEALANVAKLVSEFNCLYRLSGELEHDATHDPLTRLANRALMSDRLSAAMSRRDRRDGEPVVAVIDLDGFKPINDQHGHAAGDRVLVEIAQRLRQSVRPGDLVARLGGDEFVVIVEHLPPHQDPAAFAVDLADRLAAVVEDPITVGAAAVAVGASAGAVCARSGELSYEVLGRADAAMFTRKLAARAT
jgi:diguanylate cyclase (GGDEF)-like protein